MQLQTVSKSEFKAKALEYLRLVEARKEPILITHAGKPVIQVSPFKKTKGDPLKVLAGTVLKYLNPNEPIGINNWEALK